MAQGTGLPLLKPDTVLSRAPSIDADAVSSAAAWTKIATAGERVANQGLDILSKDEHVQQAGAVASFENDWRTKNIEARDKFANDPDGFKNWAQNSIDGAVSQAPAWMADHVKSYLTRTFDGSYAAILNEKRARDTRLAGQALEARRKAADDDVMALASGGKVGTAEWNAAVAVHNTVLQSAVEAGRVPQEQADYIRSDLAGRAQGEMAARDAVTIFHEKGFDAAVKHLTETVRDNDKLSLSVGQRQAAFNRGLSAVRLEQARLKEDKTEAVEAAKDLRSRIGSNQDIDPNEVRDIATELARTGAFNERRQLLIAAGVHDATAAYRPGGGRTLPELGRDLARMRHEAFPSLQGAISAAAFRYGVPADFLTATAIREGTGRNPNSTAEGFFQFTKQTWLATFKEHAADIGLGDLATQITGAGMDSNRLTVEDPQARARIFGLRNDPMVAATMAAAFTAGNARALQNGLGRQPTPGELYAAHFLGPGGALTMLKADKGARAADINPAAAAANTSIFYDKEGRARTVGEVLANLTSTGASIRQSDLGAITKGVQDFYVAQERKLWPQMKGMLEKGEITDPDEFDALRYAAQVSGDTAWSQEVEAFAEARGFGRILAATTTAEGQAALDQLRSRLGDDGLTVTENKVIELLQKQYERQVKLANDDPIGLALETDPSLKPPPAIDFSNAQAAQAAFSARVSLARRTAAAKDVPVGSPLRPADRASTAAAISHGNADQTAAALNMLASAPDDMLLPTLQAKEIKEAVAGAALSSDPARYNAAMSFMDRVWQRAPESVDRMFGSDAVHELAAWQVKRRYLTPEDMAKERSQAALDPQVRERQKANFNAGLAIARKVKPDDVIAKFDTSWWPGGPSGPADPIARDALMGDWANNVARVYAETLDKDKAIEKGTEITATKWSASPLNGGKLMLNAPEKYYPDIGGSWDWMRAQLEEELSKTIGAPSTVEPSLGSLLVPGTTPERNYSWELVADRKTEMEAQAFEARNRTGARPSYQVVVTDHRTGAMRVLPQRARWQTDAGPGNPVEAFARQRARVLAQERFAPISEANVPFGVGLTTPY